MHQACDTHESRIYYMHQVVKKLRINIGLYGLLSQNSVNRPIRNIADVVYNGYPRLSIEDAR